MLLVVELWHRQENRPDRYVGNLTIVETVNQKDEDSPYWAFGEGCEPLLCSDAPADAILTFETIIQMRKPLPKTKFLDTCTKNKLHYREIKDEPRRLVRSIRSFPGDWKPKLPSGKRIPPDAGPTEGPPPSSEPPAPEAPPEKLGIRSHVEIEEIMEE